MVRPFHVLSVVGARPNFMKIAPLAKLLRDDPGFQATLVHTGQHYDAGMSEVFFRQLDIPLPDVNLNVGSMSHARQTAAIMTAFEPVLLQLAPDLVVVVGDVNSTIAGALVATKLRIPVAHVEAGLRSFDRSMPEEINRVLTDQIADLLFTTERSAGENLEREGIPRHRIHFVGNVMIDTLRAHLPVARALNPAIAGDLTDFALLTLHRPSNVDDRRVLEELLQAVSRIGEEVPVVFPVHPRTRTSVLASATASRLVQTGTLRLLEPLGYLEFLNLMDRARVVLTDSGGIQEETTVLGVPCLTLRQSTERPVTVSEGTNLVVGTDAAAIMGAWRRVREGKSEPRTPELWDGRAAERIVGVLRQVARDGARDQ